MCAYLHCSWLAFPKACQQGWSEKVLDKEKRRRGQEVGGGKGGVKGKKKEGGKAEEKREGIKR